MCTDEQHKQKIALLRQIEEASHKRPPIDSLKMISNSRPLVIDYKDRNHIYIRSINVLSLQVEDIGTIVVPPNVWVNADFQTGMKLTPTQTTTVPVFVRSTDDLEWDNSPAPSVPLALTAYSGNATQTAAASADTPYKFGANGDALGRHLSLQNNSASAVYYAFDQSTTASGNMVYILSAGSLVFWDRVFTVLHFSSGSQISFGGTSGITVEAFA